MERVIAWELDILGSHGMASADYPAMLRLVEAGTLRPQALVERVVGLTEGARLLPSLDSAAPSRRHLDRPAAHLRVSGQANPRYADIGIGSNVGRVRLR